MTKRIHLIAASVATFAVAAFLLGPVAHGLFVLVPALALVGLNLRHGLRPHGRRAS